MTAGLDAAAVDRVARDFTRLYHDLREQTLGRTRWLGVSVVKTPTDLISLQEVIAETRPEIVVETGVFAGGSAQYIASLMDLLEIDGRVIGIDVDLSAVSPRIASNPRIELIEGSSTSPAVIVDLDADHGAEHVLAELRALGPLVTPGCYLVVEDTWLGGRPVRPDQAPGPAGALETWLAEGQPFEVDRWRERFMLTACPRGYLRRLGGPSGGPPRLEAFAVPDSGRTGTIAAGPEAVIADLRHRLAEQARIVEELRRGPRRHDPPRTVMGKLRRAFRWVGDASRRKDRERSSSR
jgi:cephalosporin hydroxylase